MSKAETVHVPVMMKEALDGLNLSPGMCVVDATLGGGGYTREILKRVGETGHVIAVDADQEAIKRFKASFPEESGKVTLVHSNYASVREVLRKEGISTVDAIVADLGLSSDQIEEGVRGFAFAQSGPVDMRMNQEEGISAQELIASASADELAEIFYRHGDERHARRAAQAIKSQPEIRSTEDLATVIEKSIGKYYRSKKIHPATRIFQALRIAVNDEYRNLEKFLTAGLEMLREGGRMSIVTFHSGEDRIVKNVFRSNARGCICPPEIPVCRCAHKPLLERITRKPLTPTEEEIKENPRARSAKTRVIEKIIHK